ncbi:MAG: VTT domain-containing protein [Mucilaginibacter sp.]
METIFHFILHPKEDLSTIISLYHALTYLILFAIIFAETGLIVAPFLPGDSLLFAAGALLAPPNTTGLSIYVLALILIVAAFLGNTVNYLVGNYMGPKVFKPQNKILKLDYYLQTKAFFDKHGGKAVILSRFMPIIRTVAPFVAGVGRMSFLRYSLYNIVGGASWIILFLLAGYELGQVDFFQKHFSLVGVVIIIISLLPPIIAAIKSRSSKKVA